MGARFLRNIFAPTPSSTTRRRCFLIGSAWTLTLMPSSLFKNKHHFQGKTVLYVGSGGGILAICSAQAGARKVYVVPVEATKMAEHNRLRRICDSAPTMRFKKGTKVKVQSKKDMPPGSWRCAEIIDGNGKNYTVRFDGHAGAANEITMERLSRDVIRPCPPLFKVMQSLFPGNAIEVLDKFSWKMATVSRVLGKTNYLVRLLGSPLELKVGKLAIWTRQSCQNNKWIAIGKGYGNCEDGKHNDTVPLAKKPNLSARVQKTRQEQIHIQKMIISIKTMK